jgi:hypothetical protein
MADRLIHPIEINLPRVQILENVLLLPRVLVFYKYTAHVPYGIITTKLDDLYCYAVFN